MPIAIARSALLMLGLIASLPPSQATADDATAQAVREPGAFRVESNLVLLRFHVVHKRGFAVGLGPGDFRIYEDGVEQPLAAFDGPGLSDRKLPFELMMLIDNSGTVAGLMDYSSLARTLAAGLHEGALLSVHSFSHGIKCLAPPTRDLASLERALKGALGQPGLDTRLYAAIIEACTKAETSETSAVQTVLVISDGLATDSGKRKEAIEIARRLGIRVYPVLIGQMRGRPDDPFDPVIQYLQMGEETGGRSFATLNPVYSRMKAILDNIALEIRTEYVVGYRTSVPKGSGRHNARIRLVDKTLGAVRGGEKQFVR